MTLRGGWNTVWTSFDQRRKAKGGDVAANEGADSDGPDMFGVQAAE